MKTFTIMKFVLFSVVLLVADISAAQTNTALKTTPKPADINLKVYEQSASIGDYATAISAVHYLIASDPVKYATWADTLAVLYYRNNNLQQSYIITEGLINNKGYTELRMQIKALSAKGLQATVEAINAYAVLFSKTNTAGYGYEELQLEYAMRRLAETVATGNKLLQIIPANDSSWVTVINADNKTMQKVALKAAVHNILGLAYVDLKEADKAKEHFEAALKNNPDFEQAKNNLAKSKTTDGSRQP